jgi:PKD repeat protein
MKAQSSFMIAVLFFSATLCYSQYTLTLQPGPEGKDAIISDYYTVGYGEHTNNYAMAGTSSGVPFVCRFLLEFDLSDLPSPCWVVDARLSLFYANDPSNPHSHYGDNWSLIQRVTEPWEELEVSWWNQPPVTTDDQLRIPPSVNPTQDYLDLDLTAMVSKWADEPDSNFGMLVRIETEEIYRRIMFASSDYLIDPEKRPHLEVTYLLCEPPEASFLYETTGMSVAFAGSATSALTWHWDFGDGDTSNLQNPVHEYLDQGFYEVCLTVHDACYFDQTCQVVEICTEPPQAAFTSYLGGMTVSFSNETLVGATYLWDFGDGLSSTEENPIHTYEVAGDYTVCLTAWNSCGEDSVCAGVFVCDPPLTLFYYDPMGVEVQFWEACMMAEQFHWDFGDGNTSKYSNPLHSYVEAGVYEVCLTAFNSCDTATYCDWVYVDFAGETEKEEVPAGLSVFPNPALDQLTVSSELKTGKLIIYDMNGRTVKKIRKYNSSMVNIDISAFSPGVYLVRIESDEGKVASGKFVKTE